MYKHDLVSLVKMHFERNPSLQYYRTCLDQIEKLNFVSHNDSLLLETVPKEPPILESIRVAINSSPNKYHIYLYHRPKKNSTNYMIPLGAEERDRFLYQLVTVTNYNDIIGLTKEVNFPNIHFKMDQGKYQLYFVMNTSQPKFKKEYYELKNLYEISGYIYGIDVLNLIKYQRLDRIINFIKRGGESEKLYSYLNYFLKELQTEKWYNRDRMMIMSGAVFQALGTTYTRDIDLLVVAEKIKPDNVGGAMTPPRQRPIELLVLAEKIVPPKVNSMIKRFEDFKINIDPNILISDGNWYDKRGALTYKRIWLTHALPNLVGALDIFEVLANPSYHFYFMGIKFISLEINIVRILQRASVSSLADLIMLEKINAYPLGPRLCIPNMTVRQGLMVVFDRKAIDKIQQSIQKKIKLYYDFDISLDEVKKMVDKCHVDSFKIYAGPVIRDPVAGLIKAFHLDVKDQLYQKYLKGASNLLDVGSGQLDIKFWKRYHVSNVVGIEPSIESIKRGLKKLENDSTVNVTIINGFGDVMWKNDETYKPVYLYTYDVVSFQYTIHYMVRNLDIVLSNIIPVMRTGSKVIITCMDGDKIRRELDKNTKIEIRDRQEPIFYIRFYESKDDILVYFRGTYGVANGSVESLVDINRLVEIFKENNLRLLERKNFLEYNSKLKAKMIGIQKMVSSYYVSLVFEFVGN